jgi:hypothetical protein
MNRIKDELTFPSPMDVCNVTNLYKNKGSEQHFDSYHGIFRTPVLRNILDKLIYEDEYEEIDDNLTYCNVGARKRRNVRDNLFVINAIMNASKQDPKQALDVNVYDVKKCYDLLWLEETINDHKILREIIGAQCKVPVEMLYLETGAIPIKSVMAVKRIIYLHNIVSRDNSELLYRVYFAMKNEPIKGDWINIVRKDMEEIDIKFSDDEISMMSKTDFKSIVKKKMRKHVLDELNTMKEGNAKVRDIDSPW